MKSLSQYIRPTTSDSSVNGIDGHIHLFNHESSIKLLDNFDHFVGFEDIEFKYLKQYRNGQTLEHYKQYIETHDLSKITLCATGVDSETIIKTYEAYPKIIKGFGELKCYDQDKYHNELPFNNLNWVREILRYDEKLAKPLPVIIHYSLDSQTKITRLNTLLDRFTNIPIVLCHCGMPGHEYESKLTDDEIFWAIQSMQRQHSNLWLDVSYSGLDYFSQNPSKLYMLDVKRVYFGTDINPTIYRLDTSEKFISDVMDKLDIVKPYIQSDTNIKTLFRF